MNTRELVAIGIPAGPCAERAKQLLQQARAAGQNMRTVVEDLTRLAGAPASFVDHVQYGDLAQQLVNQKASRDRFRPRESDAPYRVWGSDLEPDALTQMRNACKLPVAVWGALMPDAHVGYGLPIGGVLATTNAVIPFAVGVDIACRMRLSIYPLPPSTLHKQQPQFEKALLDQTRFGVGASWQRRERPTHEVLGDPAWQSTKLLQSLQGKAEEQLGTSGTGNHFVEWGVFRLYADDVELGLTAGEYLALLSHSGSRGVGFKIANTFTETAQRLHPTLEKSLRHLAWLSLESEPGQEYWLSMEL